MIIHLFKVLFRNLSQFHQCCRKKTLFDGWLTTEGQNDRDQALFSEISFLNFDCFYQEGAIDTKATELLPLSTSLDLNLIFTRGVYWKLRVFQVGI